MADDVTVDNGEGGGTNYVVATDDVGGEHAQLVKLTYSADGDRTHVAADADGLLVNLGGNNDVTVSGVATAANQATVIGHLDGVEGLLGTIDADTGGILTAVQIIDNAISGNEMQVDVVTVPAPLSTTGAGTEAAALRVTVATDSTGVLSVDDNGASLTVDGTVAVSSLPALAAGTANIGDVDVLSVVPGTAATSLGKAEDAAHASGDTGVMALAVRQNTPTALATTDADYAPLEVGAVGEQWVGLVGHNTTARIAVNSASLTTASTAYVTGDVLGSELSFTSAARISGGRGVIESATLLDKSDVIGAVDLYLFNAASTPAADNAANSWSDANMELLEGIIHFATPVDSALNRVGHWYGAIPYQCAATTLFGVMVTRSGHTFFGAATDLRVTLHVRYE